MSNPNRMISLVFIATMASACWPGAWFNKSGEVAPTTQLDAWTAEDGRLADEDPANAPATDGAPATDEGSATEPQSESPTAVPAPKTKPIAAPRRRVTRARRSKPDACRRGTFFDPRGECWSCPKGTHRTIFPVTAKNACEKRLQIKHRRVAGKMAATGLISTDCKRGWFLHRLSGTCYRCPKGFKRTVFSINGGKACERWEGPVWRPAKFDKKLTCGDNGNRACTVGERIPSCDKGLKEDKNAVCVPLEKGEVPFLAGLGAKTKAIADLGTGACRKLVKPFVSTNSPLGPLGMGMECRSRAAAGFMCEIPGAIDQVSSLTDFAVDFGKAWETKPCSEWSPAARPLCATASAVVGDAPAVLKCVGAAVKAGALGQIDAGEVCEAGGQIAFQVAVLRKMKLKGKPGKKESRLDQLKRLLSNSATVGKGAADVSQQLDRLAECRILD